MQLGEIRFFTTCSMCNMLVSVTVLTMLLVCMVLWMLPMPVVVMTILLPRMMV